MRKFLASILVGLALLCPSATMQPLAQAASIDTEIDSIFRYVIVGQFVYIYMWQWPGIWVLVDVQPYTGT